MGLKEEAIDGLSYMESHMFHPDNNVTDYLQTNSYYCSYAKVAYVNDTLTYRFYKTDFLDEVHFLCKAKNVISLVFFGLAIILGVPGNIIALITVSTMPKTTGTFYISLLSFSDLMALLSIGSKFFLDKYKFHYTSGLCQFIQFSTNYSTTYANWVLMCIFLERYITIRFPLKKSYYLTPRRARYSALVLALVLLPVFLVFIFFTESYNGVCIYSSPLEEFYRKIYSRIIVAFYSFIPVVFLFTFTTLVIVQLRKHEKTWRVLLSERGEKKGPDRESMDLTGHVKGREAPKCRFRPEAMGRSITIMMIFTAVVFIVLTIPLCVLYVIYIKTRAVDLTPVTYARNELLLRIAICINLLSHAINFFIYFLSTRKFRRHLHSLVGGKRKTKWQLGTSLLSKSSRDRNRSRSTIIRN